MTDKTAVLKTFDNEKLIDVVKNYEQYGYNDDLRNIAIGILEDRGIDKNQLMLTGNFENETYKTAENFYNSFKQNSIITFIFYIIGFITAILLPVFAIGSELLSRITLLIAIIAIILYLIFFIRSFINQVNFFKIIEDLPGLGTLVIYFLLGVPLFVFLYFFYKNKMKEQMKLIK